MRLTARRGPLRVLVLPDAHAQPSRFGQERVGRLILIDVALELPVVREGLPGPAIYEGSLTRPST